MSVKATLGNFADSTSLHGVSRIKSSERIVQKVIWALLVVGGLVISGYQIYRLTMLYLRVPVNTVISHKMEKMRFPVVTVCSVNPVKYSMMVAEARLYQVIMAMADTSGTDISQFNLLLPFPVPNHTYSEFLDTYDSEGFSRGNDIFYQRLNYYSTSALAGMSLEVNQFIKSCSFRGRFCDADNFTVVRLERYGLCYQFVTQETIDSAGPEKGLELILMAEQREFVPFITETVGVRVDIHGHDEPSLMETNGISVPTQFQTEIGVTKSVNRRLPGLSDKCSKKGYSRLSACLLDCLENQVFKECACAPSYILARANNGTPCEDTISIECKDNIMKNSDVSRLCPNCKIPCSEVNYQTTVAMTGWPTEQSKESIGSSLGLGKTPMFDNVVKLKIYVASLMQTISEEEEVYGLESFVSDIGGTLGLLVGLSVLSVVEVLELLILLCVSAGKRLRDSGKRKGGVVPFSKPREKDSCGTH